MKKLSCIVVILFIGLGASVIYAVFKGDFFAEFGMILDMSWGLVTIVDLYVGFVLLSIWVYWREKTLLTTLIITLFIMTLGNLIACLYLLYAAYDSRGDMMKLVNGKRVVTG